MQSLELSDERKEADAIPDHCGRVALSNALATHDDDGLAVLPTEIEQGAVAVAVEEESRALGPFVSNGGEHAVAVHLVECVAGIDEKEAIIFFLRVLVIHLTDGQGAAFDSGLEAGA